MCNEKVKRQLVTRLCDVGRVTSDSASTRELREQLGFDVSNNVFKRALGSAIRDRLVTRRRRPATGPYDDHRPITLTPGPAATVRTTPIAQPLPYFVSS